MSKPKKSQPANRYEMETFFGLGPAQLAWFERNEPFCINEQVNVHKWKVTFELIREPDEVIIERLRKLWRNSDNFHHARHLRTMAKKYGVELDFKERGKDHR